MNRKNRPDIQHYVLLTGTLLYYKRVVRSTTEQPCPFRFPRVCGAGWGRGGDTHPRLEFLGGRRGLQQREGPAVLPELDTQGCKRVADDYIRVNPSYPCSIFLLIAFGEGLMDPLRGEILQNLIQNLTKSFSFSKDLTSKIANCLV